MKFIILSPVYIFAISFCCLENFLSVNFIRIIKNENGLHFLLENLKNNHGYTRKLEEEESSKIHLLDSQFDNFIIENNAGCSSAFENMIDLSVFDDIDSIEKEVSNVNTSVNDEIKSDKINKNFRRYRSCCKLRGENCGNHFTSNLRTKRKVPARNALYNTNKMTERLKEKGKYHKDGLDYTENVKEKIYQKKPCGSGESSESFMNATSTGNNKVLNKHNLSIKDEMYDEPGPSGINKR
ncbi:Plasmodium exported protein, unknown function [Plasmodium relictum]|uniref:Uncharacterized protein n=1 Tax=Plasmodium relictum TaxID=85471 RepID=A0A1J1HH84_PLARL|nr:Plasmodium exported protein, unknown function [Plasmodium relictum]CRH03644.1 Plasmodium exported protein, unknown function [Plasmodium relictum]